VVGGKQKQRRHRKGNAREGNSDTKGGDAGMIDLKNERDRLLEKKKSKCNWKGLQ